MHFKINNLQELESLAHVFSSCMEKGDIFLLSGDMGAGKTTFVSFVVKNIGMENHVCSPTFTLINRYNVKKEYFVYHMDLYRIESESDLLSLDLDSYFAKRDRVIFIEWSEKLGIFCPEEFLMINFQYKNSEDFVIGSHDEEMRLIELVSKGQRYDKLLMDLKIKLNGCKIYEE
jgi:tRNA threonylcarbamoyladenosine biosynthesis protein TsaE